MNRINHLLLLTAAFCAPATALAQDPERVISPAVNYDDYLAEAAAKLNAAQELPDLNLGGYKGLTWGQATAPGLVDSPQVMVLGQPVTRTVSIGAGGKFRRVSWTNPSTPDSTALLDQLRARYGEPSMYNDGESEEAIWIGAISTLVYRRRNEGWTLELSPSHR